MARRLSPQARRAEIIEVAQEVIAREGYRGLSLREVARRCGMSAPGLMHYFPDMDSLLFAVLEHRDEVDLAAIFDADGAETSLLDMLGAARKYYSERAEEARSFDALEAEALDPKHPAHDYFARRNDLSIQRLRPQIEREFESPEEVARVLALILDGVRLKRLQEPVDDWSETVADLRAITALLDRCPRRNEARSGPAPAEDRGLSSCPEAPSAHPRSAESGSLDERS